MNPIGWAKGFAFMQAAKMKKRIDDRRGDLVLLQLRGLEKAYSKATGPDVLFIVDSMSVYAGKEDEDRRGIVQMVMDELPAGTTHHVIAGPAYPSELNLAFVSALEKSSSRPKLVVVPNHFGSNLPCFTDHPRVGYRVASEMIREAVANGGKRPRHLRPTPPEQIEAYDSTVAPTVSGLYRTWGELRMSADSRPTSKAQAKARKAYLMDCYWGGRLQPGDPGPEWTRRLSAEIHRLGMLGLGVQLPIDWELTNKLLDVSVESSALANIEVSEAAFREGADDAVTINMVFDCLSSDYRDPLHLNQSGRRKIVDRLAPVVKAMLDEGPEKAQLLADEGAPVSS